MRYENDGMTGLNIAYIGGGSSGWARTFMTVRLLDGSRHEFLNEKAGRDEKWSAVLTFFEENLGHGMEE